MKINYSIFFFGLLSFVPSAFGAGGSELKPLAEVQCFGWWCGTAKVVPLDPEVVADREDKEALIARARKEYKADHLGEAALLYERAGHHKIACTVAQEAVQHGSYDVRSAHLLLPLVRGLNKDALLDFIVYDYERKEDYLEAIRYLKQKVQTDAVRREIAKQAQNELNKVVIDGVSRQEMRRALQIPEFRDEWERYQRDQSPRRIDDDGDPEVETRSVDDGAGVERAHVDRRVETVQEAPEDEDEDPESK